MPARVLAVATGAALLALLGAGAAAGQVTIPTITTITLPTSTTTTTAATTTTTSATTTTTAPTTTTTADTSTTTGSTTTSTPDSTTTTTDASTTTTSASTTTTSTSTTTTTTTPPGALTISVPGAVSVSGSSGGVITAQLGQVTVNGGGTVVPRSWMVTVTASDFVSSGEPAGTIPAANISYASGPAAAGSVATAVPGQATTALAVPMGTSVVAFSGTFGIEASSAAWNPTIVITAPGDAPRGDYTGTITHSVA